MEDLSQFIKSLIRPFIIVCGFILYSICILTNVEVPPLLAGLVSVVIIEYFGERAIKRFKENDRPSV
jgi:hypothetical protein